MQSVSCSAPTLIKSGSIEFTSQINPGVLYCYCIHPIEIIAPSVATHNVPGYELAEGVSIAQAHISNHLVWMRLRPAITQNQQRNQSKGYKANWSCNRVIFEPRVLNGPCVYIKFLGIARSHVSVGIGWASHEVERWNSRRWGISIRVSEKQIRVKCKQVSYHKEIII